MDFIPQHLHKQPRRELSAHEHNQATYVAIQGMIITLGVMLVLLVFIFTGV